MKRQAECCLLCPSYVVSHRSYFSYFSLIVVLPLSQVENKGHLTAPCQKTHTHTLMSKGYSSQ